jgi:hypothetical protein
VAATTGSFPRLRTGSTAPCVEPRTYLKIVERARLIYINYSPNKLNNFTLRTEYFDDPQGQRTGIATRYADVALGWQHWFS